MKAKNFFATKDPEGKAIKALVSDRAKLIAQLKKSSAKVQFQALMSGLFWIYGGDEHLPIRGWEDVVGDLAVNLEKWGDKCHPLTEKQVEWVANSMCSMWWNVSNPI